MKPMLPLIALALATTTPLAHSAEVISADRDRTVGYGAGGVVGVMVGAALGGPLGAVDRRQGLRAALRAADAGRRIATSGAFAVSCRDPTAAQLGGLDAPGPPRLSTHPEGLAA